MKLKRMCELSHAERNKIRKRQQQGTMTEYYEKGYLCYDVDELAIYKPKPQGRPAKLSEATLNKMKK